MKLPLALVFSSVAFAGALSAQTVLSVVLDGELKQDGLLSADGASVGRAGFSGNPDAGRNAFFVFQLPTDLGIQAAPSVRSA